MTPFDTSVVIDARDANSPWHEWAKEKIADAGAADDEIVNTVVIAEAPGGFVRRDELLEELERMGLSFAPLPVSAAIPASEACAIYRSKIKAHGDFFIGVRAEAEGMKLVTRDPDRIETHFPSVKFIVPND